MAIKQKDLKLLWGRAGGRCSNPDCRKTLLPNMKKSGDTVLGDMAHVIGRRPEAARSDESVGEDDSYENLILLCTGCHSLIDKAPADFSRELLLQWKRDWENDVAQALLSKSSVQMAEFLEMRLWSFFNFSVLLTLYEQCCPIKAAQFNILELQQIGAVNKSGHPQKGQLERGLSRTVFETWDQSIVHEMHRLYSGMTEELLRSSTPVDIDSLWGIRLLRGHLFPGAIAFTNRRFFFKSIPSKDNEPERRQVRARARGIEIRFQIDTWGIYSNSALTLHFCGQGMAAALLLIRDIARPSEPDSNLRLVVTATPIALGIGFFPPFDRTPEIALQRMYQEEE